MAKHSILIVEDEQTLRRLLEYRLGKTYDVRTAANGREALNQVAEEAPDLIVSDIMMPKLDGFGLQSALEENDTTRAIPFIFLTAKADEKSRLRGLRTGVDDYITKPFDIDQLLSRIERLLERTHLFQTQLDAKIGKDFSEKLMPKKMPSVEGYRMLFHNNPREQGGGDLFDLTRAEADQYFITIGDVMGKGIQAKFYAFSFLGYVRSILRAMLNDTRSPAELMHRINEVLMRDEFMDETFASLLLMRWDPENHEITYTNAGHCRPILLTGDGPELVTYSDMVLGLKPDVGFTDTTIGLPPGSALLMYTDGLIEQQLRSGKMLGEEGLMHKAAQAYGADEPIERTLSLILEDSEEEEFTDDILVFWLERGE